MSALLLTSSKQALREGLTASFLAVGGTSPYTFSVLPGGAGGSINSSGVYTAPAVLPTNPRTSSDTIRVTDHVGATASLPILVTDTLGLFCEIIQSELGLASGRVYLWDQKINEPNDNGLFIAVSALNPKPFGNTLAFESSGGGLQTVQSTNMVTTLSLDIISRDLSAYARKEEVIMALNSLYSQQQQTANSFYIGTISRGFNNLSEIDGAAIPYRYNISVNIQYFIKKISNAEYFDTFQDPTIATNP